MIRGRDLIRQSQLQGAETAGRCLVEGLQDGIVSPRDVSIRDLAAALVTGEDGQPVGYSWVHSLGPQRSGGLMLQEAAAGVSMSNFNNVTGQLIYTRIMEAYQSEEFVLSGLVQSYQTDFSGEKIPGITGITEDVQEVAENMPFPEVGFGDDYIETPATQKRGLICSVTKETIFFDRTNLVLNQAASIGQLLGLKKEKLLLDLAFGITNNYKWRGTSYNTYLTSGAWINKQTGVTVTDWTQIDTAEQLFVNMLDPNTGEPIILSATDIFCMPSKLTTFRRILNATEIRHLTQTSTVETLSSNPLGSYSLYSSRLAYRRLLASGVSAANAANYWLFGDLSEAFAWQYNWPLTVVRAPSNAEAEFKQDIVLRWKASERGSGVVLNPRKVALTINA